MVQLIIEYGTSTPISRQEKRLDTLISLYQTYSTNMVPTIGVEPIWISPMDFESIASTNFTTWAVNIF